MSRAGHRARRILVGAVADPTFGKPARGGQSDVYPRNTPSSAPVSPELTKRRRIAKARGRQLQLDFGRAQSRPAHTQHSSTPILQHSRPKFISLNNLKSQHKFKPMDDDQFRQLLDWFDFSWSGYRKVRKGVKKRISRHMQELKCPNINAYLDLLNKSAELRKECEMRMTVSISRFFRDRKLWVGLEEDILPRMIETHPKKLQVWSAGCARGEEVYSFRIVWQRLKQAYEHLPELNITGTDKHPGYIEKARAGVYSKSSLKEVPPEMRAYYFDIRKSGNRFDIKAAFKKGIDWKVQDIFSNPPGSAFDIIFLRNNLLTYYREHLKIEGLHKVMEALAPDGWLIVGSHEKLPAEVSNVQRQHSIPWAYRQDV